MSLFVRPSIVGVQLIAALAVCGCSGKSDRPKTYAVTGQVAYQQKPVEGASVSFWAEGASRAAVGTTDKDGKFSLSTYELNDGAIPGTHKVTVSKNPPNASPPAAAPTVGDPADLTKTYTEMMKNQSKAPKSELPIKYANLTTTTLTAEVKAGENEPFVFPLTD